MDPLSQHIATRTNAPLNIPYAQRPASSDGNSQRSDEPRNRSPAPAVQQASAHQRSDTEELDAHKDLKKGVKAVSFISRLMGSAKKREAGEDVIEDEQASNEERPEGNDASVFAQPLDNMSFNPRHPQPPGYIKMRSKNKREREFDYLFLAQELECRPKRPMSRSHSSNKLRRKGSATPEADTVWAMEFSRDGKYLAAAGADMTVRVWAVLSSPEDREKHEKQEAETETDGMGVRGEHLSAPVFQTNTVREYEGHTSTVLDLAWSKNNFLLSSSMDKTVRLWHVSRAECLCTFKHTDFVPSIAFHPKDDRFFIAGSLDRKLRLWSIPDKSVAYAVQVPDMITAVAFTPDGKCAMAGCLTGLCMFYETEGLKYQTQLHVRSTRGQNAKGSKITGIQAHSTFRGDTKLLITSNDSRVRLYNFRDKSLEMKFKGNENNSSQIRASISDCGRYVLCGSEDRKVYIWSLGVAEGEKRDKRPMEMFEAHDTVATAVCLAPAKTRYLLSKSEDPIYDICNPPPVQLRSMAEQEQENSPTSSKPPTETGSVLHTPADTRFEKPQPSPAYLARSGHKDGNIIVTADYLGKIKVFRQDCAHAKRKLDDSDRASIFSKRNGRSSRTGSIATRASQRSLRDSRPSFSATAPSDRILSWRQDIASTSDIAGQRSSSKHTMGRSISPRKSYDRRAKPTHQASDDALVKTKTVTSKSGQASTLLPSNSNDENPLLIQNGQSNVFWDTSQWAKQVEKMRKERDGGMDGNHSHPQRSLTPVMSDDERGDHGGARGHLAVRPGLGSDGTASLASYVSRLSDERSRGTAATSDAGDEFDDAPER
ncbi:putative WD repeat-containing protein [Teratosphaeria destructans]|uniref:WD repeat-containing protein n=1 Tax=Teratosphaeria destructans TaxID=418781 RepID=A0A9W7SZ33_9PEZI|nr:putative WD repeat-containing protein [Teratosphaeria destructans]